MNGDGMASPTQRQRRHGLVMAMALVLAGCGGGGNPGACLPGSALACRTNDPTQSGAITPATPVDTTPLASSESLANVCTADGEKRFVRSHLDEVYLWYKEIPARQRPAYSSVEDYFYALLVPARDRFSFVSPADEIGAFLQSGQDLGLGVEWKFDTEGRLRAGWVEPLSPAAGQALQRGAHVLSVDGVAVPNGSLTTAQSNALFPSATDVSVAMVVADRLAGPTRTVQIISAKFQKTPVPPAKVLPLPPGGKVGYLQFNDHILTAENPLADEMTALRNAGITDLVLDMRYNRGGYLFLASEVAAMIAGPSSRNKVFEQLVFNDKQTALVPPSYTTTHFYDVIYAATNPRSGEQLPALNLRRVFVLTGGSTCSASESIINGLRGIDVEVIQIGRTSCGKPYGFFERDNCGKAYFAIEFEGVNAKGQGGYSDGLVPQCVVEDDFEHALGDSAEGRLKAALYYQQTGMCPAAPSAMKRRSGAARVDEPGPRQSRPGKLLLR